MGYIRNALELELRFQRVTTKNKKFIFNFCKDLMVFVELLDESRNIPWFKSIDYDKTIELEYSFNVDKRFVMFINHPINLHLFSNWCTLCETNSEWMQYIDSFRIDTFNHMTKMYNCLIMISIVCLIVGGVDGKYPNQTTTELIWGKLQSSCSVLGYKCAAIHPKYNGVCEMLSIKEFESKIEQHLKQMRSFGYEYLLKCISEVDSIIPPGACMDIRERAWSMCLEHLLDFTSTWCLIIYNTKVKGCLIHIIDNAKIGRGAQDALIEAYFEFTTIGLNVVIQQVAVVMDFCISVYNHHNNKLSRSPSQLSTNCSFDNLDKLLCTNLVDKCQSSLDWDVQEIDWEPML